ncbi:MAG: gliding motility-associated C-terminal domain-containing protein [Flavobacteriales bacterium]|nr:gliding motility-associated C-terminal domain-containing protein [Flavobacteriales bacterium]
MKKYIITIFLSVCSAGFFGQNLVPNPGMENTYYCPSASGQMDAVQFWQKPETGTAGTGTSDYYNTCDLTSGLPNNGAGHIGFISYINFIPNAREYAQVQLTQPLEPTTCYEVSLWVRTEIGSGFQMTDLGLLFGDTAIASPGGTLIDVTPQISTVDLIGEMWTQVIDTVTTPLASDYEWLTIGVFVNDASTISISPTGTAGFGLKFMIDDVSVTKIEIDTIGIDLLADTSICYGQTINLVGSSTLGTTYRWYDLATGVGISGGLNLPVTVTSDTAFVFMAGAQCSPYFADTVRITIDPISAITQLNEEICPGENIMFGGQYYSSEGVYADTLSALYGCDSIVELTLTISPELFTSVTIKICPGDTVFFGSSYYHNIGEYRDTLESEMGCDSISELILSPCESLDTESAFTFYIPNSFTPNEDGLNDVFTPIVNGFETTQLMVFNRWGAMIFEATDDLSGWTGSHQGSQAQMDVYAYKFSGRLINGGAIVKTGHVFLIR